MPPGNRDIHDTPRTSESNDMPKSDHDLLIRIYERQKTQDERLSGIEASLTKLDERYVSQQEFWPIKTIVYTGAGLILIAVLTAVVALVVKGGVNVQVKLEPEMRMNSSLAYQGGFP